MVFFTSKKALASLAVLHFLHFSTLTALANNAGDRIGVGNLEWLDKVKKQSRNFGAYANVLRGKLPDDEFHLKRLDSKTPLFFTGKKTKPHV